MPILSRILVIGGGISGCAFARMAAERGYPVDVYERLPRYGGYAELLGDGALLQFHPPQDTNYQLVRKFIEAFANNMQRVQHTGRAGYYPLHGWHWFCYSLLEHPNIRAWHSAYIQNPGACKHYYMAIYNTASLDGLFNYCYGRLAYVAGFPVAKQEQEVNRYLKYRRLAELCSFYNFGMQGAYRVLTIEEAIREAYTALNNLLQRERHVALHKRGLQQGVLF